MFFHFQEEYKLFRIKKEKTDKKAPSSSQSKKQKSGAASQPMPHRRLVFLWIVKAVIRCAKQR